MNWWQEVLWSPIPSILLSWAAGEKVLRESSKLGLSKLSPTNLVGTLFQIFPSDISVREQTGEMEQGLERRPGNKIEDHNFKGNLTMSKLISICQFQKSHL